MIRRGLRGLVIGFQYAGRCDSLGRLLIKITVRIQPKVRGFSTESFSYFCRLEGSEEGREEVLSPAEVLYHLFLYYHDRAKRDKFLYPNVYCRNFQRFLPEPARPEMIVCFFLVLYLATMSHNFETKTTRCVLLKIIKFLKQSTKPSEHELHPAVKMSDNFSI